MGRWFQAIATARISLYGVYSNGRIHDGVAKSNSRSNSSFVGAVGPRRRHKGLEITKHPLRPDRPHRSTLGDHCGTPATASTRSSTSSTTAGLAGFTSAAAIYTAGEVFSGDPANREDLRRSGLNAQSEPYGFNAKWSEQNGVVVAPASDLSAGGLLWDAEAERDMERRL
ncbi:uncharacterized protein MAM_01228 [Metarhizium album ARSEF 1941]|uniref:Uncharacterized protein n=1 Tax=Metarhizium album (strain ARSEF 1941) TaxID=1081103 RepID=A0A0B2X4R7_METAS|nr:uncharacterized protein MAM_01228 [Metarhizium album ARSEF 1941]KHO00450.1 hypothetical protein MAM_01228 [Metarhizium album ARSEF 1941]